MAFEQKQSEVFAGDMPAKSQISCGNVVTLDGTALMRPQRLTGWRIFAVIGALVVAAIIGSIFYVAALDNIVYASERQQEAVANQIKRGETVNPPALNLLIGYDNASMNANLQSAGYSMFENEVSDGSAYELIKLPSDIAPAQGKEMYQKGVAKLDPSDAAKLLTGMWRLDASSGDEGNLITVRYVDFNSGSAAAALTSAMMHEGLSEDSVTDGGIDENGNTFKVGTVEVNGVTVTWRVSTCALKEVYGVRALPDSAMYVGMRFSY